MRQRKNPKPTASPTKRFCYSTDGLYTSDGMYRWWREWDDSGYGWDGFFDIITKAQLVERMTAAQVLGVPVFEKIDPFQNEAGFLYELRILDDLKEVK